jgi:uncharacterized protein HemX
MQNKWQIGCKNMNKILAILNSKYFLSAVIGLSILVIIAGVFLVKHANEQAVVYAEQQKQITEQQSNQEARDTLKQLQAMAAQAAAELKASQSTQTGTPEKIDFTPESSKEKVANMQNKNPESGSEDWCEVMMVKPDTEWTKEEQGIFAKNCL